VVGWDNGRFDRHSIKLLLNRKYAVQKHFYKFNDRFFDDSANFLPFLN
jgi:hypothetical protein